MTKEERLKAAEAYAKQYNDVSDVRTIYDLQDFAKTDFIAGAEAEAESNKSGIETIRKRISVLENYGSKSKAAENLLFKEIDTLKWVLKIINQQ